MLKHVNNQHDLSYQKFTPSIWEVYAICYVCRDKYQYNDIFYALQLLFFLSNHYRYDPIIPSQKLDQCTTNGIKL